MLSMLKHLVECQALMQTQHCRYVSPKSVLVLNLPHRRLLSQQALMPFLFPHWSKDPKEVRQDAMWVTGKGQGSQCQGPASGDTVPGLIQRASEVRTDG